MFPQVSSGAAGLLRRFLGSRRRRGSWLPPFDPGSGAQVSSRVAVAVGGSGCAGAESGELALTDKVGEREKCGAAVCPVVGGGIDRQAGQCRREAEVQSQGGCDERESGGLGNGEGGDVAGRRNFAGVSRGEARESVSAVAWSDGEGRDVAGAG